MQIMSLMYEINLEIDMIPVEDQLRRIFVCAYTNMNHWNAKLPKFKTIKTVCWNIHTMRQSGSRVAMVVVYPDYIKCQVQYAYLRQDNISNTMADLRRFQWIEI